MNIRDNIVNILEQDRLKNINIINFMNLNTIDKLNICNNSVIIRGMSDENWVYIMLDEVSDLGCIMGYCLEDKFFVTYDYRVVEYIEDKKEIDWKLSCKKLYLPNDVKLDTPKHKACRLQPSTASYIYENSKYKDITTEEYILDKIENGIALGIYVGEDLVAWSMTHDDGCIGFLNVLDSHRRQGIAKSLTIEMINEVRKQDGIPYVHIEESNFKSMGLINGLGFIQYSDMHWIKIQ